jgi:hypothetical protein
LVLFVAVAASVARGAPSFVDSPHLATLDASPCDTRITPTIALNLTLLRLTLENPSYRVICVAPGDYRAAGRIDLWASGSPGAPRVLRFDASDLGQTAAQRSQRAVFENLYVLGSWWQIHGLTFRPRLADNHWFVTIYGGDHVVLDGNWIDGSDHPNTGANNGIVVGAYEGDPATYNTVQRNVVVNGNQMRRDVDYAGILIGRGRTTTERNDYNAILDNEVIDWGDGISVSAVSDTCTDPATQHGTIIDGNDVYVTPAKYVDCTTGAADPEGQCACAENAIDVKAMPSGGPEVWTKITNNRVWGTRPTTTAGRCGGSGSNGQAINSGSVCARNVYVARNVVADSTTGIVAAGTTWIVAGNLFHDIRESDGRGPYGTKAIYPATTASDLEIQFNTVVGADNGYDDQSSNTDTRCNVLVNDSAVAGTAGFRGAAHSTEHNYLYASTQPNIVGNTNEFHPSADDSRDVPYCYWRRRWTGPERVCVPYGATTSESLHTAAAASCDADLGAPFGEAPLGFVMAPEPAGGALAGAALGGLALAAFARRRASA